MKILYGIVIIILSTVVMAACHHQSGEHNHGDVSAETQETQYFEGTGTVISVPPSKRNIIITHGDIPGFMGAMTMPFSVRDTSVLSGIAAEDSVRFDIEFSEESTVIIKIETVDL
jgi:protein SCO1/2